MRSLLHQHCATPVSGSCTQRPSSITIKVKQGEALADEGHRKEMLAVERQDHETTMASHNPSMETIQTPQAHSVAQGEKLLWARFGWGIGTQQERWLLVVRIWLLTISIFALVIYIVGTPVYFAWTQTLCSGACNDERLTAAKLHALHASGISINIYAAYWAMINVLFVLVYFMVAALIYWRKPDDRMALFAAFSLVALGASFPDIPNALVAVHPAWRLPVALLDAPGLPSLTVFLFLFPTGRFVPGWTRWVAVGFAIVYVPGIFFPGTILSFTHWSRLLTLPIPLVWLGSLVFAQVYRYRRVSTSMERQQTKWVVLGVAVALIGFLLLGFLPVAFLPLFFPLQSLTLLPYIILVTSIYLFLLLIPLSIALALLRYRLWDVDSVINRTLVYGALTVCVIGLYVLVVGVLGTLFQAQGNIFISLLATGLIAVLFSPLRDRLQQAINRFMYGERDEPYRVISRLGQRLEATLAPDAVLPTIVETVAQALKLPYVAMIVEREGDFPVVASYGTAPDVLVRLPLIYHAEHIGELVLAPREPSEPFSSADRELLSELARQAGIAAHTVRLTADLKHLTTDLQHSRERLVTTREEERRRLRRDLHDGLGPTLATITLKAEAARDAISTDPTAAMDLLEGLIGQAQGAITDIRRLVYDLRPPALDDLGLVAAIRAQMIQYEHAGLHIAIDAPDTLPPLPAAVEVAAYRIIQEALTNVVRHANAHSCLIRLLPGESLQLEIKDDGCGILANRRSGVGLRSMHERSAELGGSCNVEALPAGGTRVDVTLPYASHETEAAQIPELLRAHDSV